jgi:universal stress protein E
MGRLLSGLVMNSTDLLCRELPGGVSLGARLFEALIQINARADLCWWNDASTRSEAAAMSTLEKVLVVVDKRMRRSAALDRGIALARKSGAQLFLCLFDHDALFDKAADLVAADITQLAKAQYLSQRKTWLAEQAASLEDRGIRVECNVAWSPVLDEAIIDKIVEIQPDLVIKDVQQEPLSRRLLHTPIDWRILRHSPVPVMLVRPTTKYLPRRIAAAVDVMGLTASEHPLNRAIVDMALKLGRVCDAEVHIVQVMAQILVSTPESLPPYEASAGIQKADREAFFEFCRTYSVPDECRHLLDGDPSAVLGRFAQRMNIDLMVLGSAYRSAADRFVLGSTSESVLGEVESDELLVKPSGFLEQLGRHLDLAAMHQRQQAAQG